MKRMVVLGVLIAVAGLSSLAGGIGAVGLGAGGFGGVVVGGIAALLGWVSWAFVTYLIGTRLLPEPQTRADVGELMRTLGFAQSPAWRVRYRQRSVRDVEPWLEALDSVLPALCPRFRYRPFRTINRRLAASAR